MCKGVQGCLRDFKRSGAKGGVRGRKGAQGGIRGRQLEEEYTLWGC